MWMVAVVLWFVALWSVSRLLHALWMENSRPNEWREIPLAPLDPKGGHQ